MSSPSAVSLARTWRRRIALALVVGGVLGAAAALPVSDTLGRRGIDLLVPQRHALYGPLYPPEESEVVAVVIDEESYRTPPFKDTPRVAWTPYLAGIISVLDAVGARVIGLDIIHPTSLDRPELLRGYDKPYLKALREAGRDGRLVMGQVRLSQQYISPYAGLVQAVGGYDNVRLLNLIVDTDNVVRRYPAGWRTEDGGWVPSFGVEIATRAGAAPPAGDFLINFNTGPGDIPAYSFADLWACGEAGNADYFRRHFADKVVLVGLALDLEDRSLTAKRFAVAAHDTRRQPRCALAGEAGFGAIVKRRTIPSIYVHAAAINDLLKSDRLRMLPWAGTFGAVAAAVFGLFLVFCAVPPLAGLAVLVAFVAAADGLAVLAFHHGLVAPLLQVAAAAAVTFALAYAYRFVVEDKARRWVKHAFAHYLAPELVERLSEDPDALSLGGESRTVAIFFSDIAGFTTLVEKLDDDPETLVDILNKYFTAMAGAVERHGGYIDKFVGDAVMAMWGAPLADGEMSRRAVEAAQACSSALDRFNREVLAEEYGMPAIGMRIGINTGLAVVGNMGSERRLNYTLTGDAVNLAARLEGANKAFGTRVMVGEETARSVRGDFLLRRLDRLVVKGKTQPVRVYEVVCGSAEAGEDERRRVAAFHRGLALYYRRRFAEAEDIFAALCGADEAAKVYVARCRHYRETPPPAGWNRAFEMTSK